VTRNMWPKVLNDIECSPAETRVQVVRAALLRVKQRR
jgi:hypothetical protein